MSPPGLLLWGAIPVPPGQQREEQRRSQLPALLRGEGVLTRVLANLPNHANSPAPPRSTCRDVGTLTYEDELLPSAASLLPSAPYGYPSLPDLVQTCPAPSATYPAPDVTYDITTVNLHLPTSPDPPDLQWTLQLLLQHLNPVASPLAKYRACPRGGARPRSFAHQGGLQNGGREVTPGRRGRGPVQRGRAGMTSALQQVGHELRRIADRLQLSMLMGWPRYEQVLYQIINSYPSWVGLAGCVVVCGSVVLLTRPLGQ